jgi:hypothetical protein
VRPHPRRGPVTSSHLESDSRLRSVVFDLVDPVDAAGHQLGDGSACREGGSHAGHGSGPVVAPPPWARASSTENPKLSVSLQRRSLKVWRRARRWSSAKSRHDGSQRWKRSNHRGGESSITGDVSSKVGATTRDRLRGGGVRRNSVRSATAQRSVSRVSARVRSLPDRSHVMTQSAQPVGSAQCLPRFMPSSSRDPNAAYGGRLLGSMVQTTQSRRTHRPLTPGKAVSCRDTRRTPRCAWPVRRPHAAPERALSHPILDKEERT